MTDKQKNCPACNGTGNCRPCDGAGETGSIAITIITFGLGSFFKFKCHRCHGTGRCQRCNGNGHIADESMGSTE